MATVVEFTQSGRGQSGRRPYEELVYTVYGADTTGTTVAERADAVAAVAAAAPTTASGLPRDTLEAVPLAGVSGAWRVTVRYSSPDSIAGGGAIVADAVTVEWDTTGATARVRSGVASISDTFATGFAGTAPSYGADVNVTDQGPQGVDVVASRLIMRLKKGFATADVTTAYMRTVAGLTGKTNDATFYGHAQGEALFLGATTLREDGTNTELQYQFSIRPNADVTLAGFGSAITVAGHNYLWTRSRMAESGTPVRLVPQVESAHVVQVYEQGDFDGLDL
jgi:hypothetical protein